MQMETKNLMLQINHLVRAFKFDEKELWLTIKTFGEYKESKYNVDLFLKMVLKQVTELKINQGMEI